MKYLLGVIAVAASVLAIGIAQAQVRTPTDIELKAAYCAKVTQGWIANFRSRAPLPDAQVQKAMEQGISQLEDRLNRLQLYLTPRWFELEPTSMIAAMKRGEADYNTFSQTTFQIFGRCTQRCVPTGDPLKDKCVQDCMDSDELVSRIQSCSNINWLPF